MTERADSCDCTVIHEDLVDDVRRRLPDDGDLVAMERLFEVLGNPTRARILLALSRHELCVCDLCVLLGMSKSAVSHQLALLRDERLVSNRRDGRIVYYRSTDPHIAMVLELGLEHARECCVPAAGAAEPGVSAARDDARMEA